MTEFKIGDVLINPKLEPSNTITIIDKIDKVEIGQILYKVKFSWIKVNNRPYYYFEELTRAGWVPIYHTNLKNDIEDLLNDNN